MSHIQLLYSAVYCNDPGDVTFIVSPKDKGEIDFRVHFWRADTNLAFADAKNSI